ncbi:MAG: 4-hydroxy-tetrahydrodipicolinate synthase [Ilumatobacteraceae bacterium]|jgi:4-hydroxy-tetrahydrodipicolinate synthase
MARFGRVVTAMVTPFDASGALDLDGARRLARWLQDHGNDGLVIAGTTGEAPVLTDAERLSLFAAVIEAVTIPVIAGTGTNDTLHSIHMTKEATALGAAGVLVVTPYYNRPSQAGIAAHMKAVAASTHLPVVMYDIPVRSGRKINTSTIVQLANDVPNVLALKDAAGNPGETASVVANTGADFEIYSGDDSLTLPLMAVGASGVIGVATHWSAPEHQMMFDRWEAGDTAGARRVNQILLPSFSYETGDESPNPIPSKVMMNHIGVPVGECRLPMGPPASFVAERAAKVWADLEARRAEGF